MTQTAPFELDVRAILAEGGEPFAAIMAATDALAPGQGLRLIAPFRPAPLLNVMAQRGFSARDQQRDDGLWQVDFTPIAEAGPGAPGLAPGSAVGASFWPDPVDSLDLTGMMPPEPMVHILERLEGMSPGAVVFALLDREPMLLFPELARRGHEWAGNFAPDGATYRLLVRCGAPDA